MTIEFNEDMMRHIASFDSVTNVDVEDCTIDKARAFPLYVVDHDQVGATVGKYGKTSTC